jgi:transcriptional regulator
VLLDRSAGNYGKLYGHISRQNPQSSTFDGEHHAVIVFRGPDAYISPTWYTKPEVVPTWNFAVVHASGRLKPITEKASLHDLLARLLRKFEGNQSAYDFGKLSETYKYGLMAGTIGFEMEIEQLEGKFKLGQERRAADKERILRSAKQGRSIQELTAAFLPARTVIVVHERRSEGPRLRCRKTGSERALRSRLQGDHARTGR